MKAFWMIVSMLLIAVFMWAAAASGEVPSKSAGNNAEVEISEEHSRYKHKCENRDSEHGTDRANYVDTEGNAYVYKTEGANITIKDQNGKLTTFKDGIHTYSVNEELCITLYSDGQIKVIKVNKENPQDSYNYGTFYTDRSMIW